MNPGEFVGAKICKECGDEVETVDSTFGLCRYCKTRRDRAYDDHVDPRHWYHQHDPDRVCEP